MVLPEFCALQDRHEGSPCARNVVFSGGRDCTPQLSKLSGTACGSAHGEQTGARWADPGCCASPGIVLAPIGGGP